MRWIFYNFLFFLGGLLLLPKLLLRMRRRGGYRAHLGQRFGRYSPETRARLGAGGALWLHAVSVGEVYVAGQLMQALRAQQPALRFVLSTTTSTGWREAERQLAPSDTLIYLPLDFPGCARRALKAIRPAAFILVESEFWPNLLRACARRGVPAFLVNGRVSDRSAPRLRALRLWFGPALRAFRQLQVQSDLDGQRLVAAGADPTRLLVTGSFKYDVARRAPEKERQAAALLAQLGMGAGCRLLLGASTWPGEEQALLAIYQALRPRYPALRLALMPRHFERAAEVAAVITAAGLTPLRKSRLDAAEAPTPGGAERVLLLDTTGESMGFYAQAALIFVGKSLLAARGAQNMIEPCLCGVPTLVGPHTGNFRPIMADLLAAEAIVQVRDSAELQQAIARLLDDPAGRVALGSRAAAAVTARRGTVERCAAQLLAAM